MLSMVYIQLVLISFLLTLRDLAVIPKAWNQEGKMPQYEPCMHALLFTSNRFPNFDLKTSFVW